MEVLVISAFFFGIVVGGAAFCGTLMVRAIRADWRYQHEVEDRPVSAPVSEPAWVEPQATAA